MKSFDRLTETVTVADRQHLYRELLAEAREAMAYAYCPQSNYPVGAAVMTDDGSVYTGCNIENANLACGTCAERTAYAKAISEGKRHFKVVAVVCDKSKDCWPCGLCRQFMREFGGQTIIVVESSDGSIKSKSLAELLPRDSRK